MLQKKYLSQNNAIASYDYVDVANGTGVQTFYLARTEQGYRLLSSALASNSIELESTRSASGSFALVGTWDFDLVAFRTPRDISGSVIVSITTYEGGNDGAGCKTKGHLVLKKNTDVLVSGATVLRQGASSIACANGLYELNTPFTHFKPGDVLRLTVESWLESRWLDAAAITWGFGLDPLNRDGTSIVPTTDTDSFTQSKVLVPFILDL